MEAIKGVADLSANEPKPQTLKQLIKMFGHIKPHGMNVLLVPKAVSQYHNKIQLGKDEMSRLSNLVVKDGAMLLAKGEQVPESAKIGDCLLMDNRQADATQIPHMETGEIGYHCVVVDYHQTIATTKKWKNSVATRSDLDVKR